MFCKYCGKQINTNAKFCSGCGEITGEISNEMSVPTYEATNVIKENGFIGFVKNLFRGRLGRLDYFLYKLLVFILPSIFFVLVPLFGNGEISDGFVIVFIIIAVFFVYPFLFAGIVRRFHDMEMSGFWFFAALIPLVSLIFSLILLFKKGTSGVNKYGAINTDRSFLKRVLNLQ